MIRAVFFDLDRTLLDRDTSFAAFASAQHGRFAHRMPGIDVRTYVDRLVSLDALGSVWKDVVYQRLIPDLGIAGVEWEELFADFDAHIAEHYVPFPALSEVLAALSREYALGIITNGKGEFQQRTIRALGIGHYFQTLLISEMEGVRKPEAEIFHRAVAHLGCRPSEAVYVGDNPEADVRAARAAGWKAIWKRNAAFAEPGADGIIDRLEELPSLLKTLDSRR
ncbi:putative hydrolase of the HAD superfamily [Roseimicrobium gellanilyticum]|uniref:Putative hydrolase of the HAD superfamily n=1 Tax=Roseimicrobium gellanilyticum TaxID=748857 RepID=A0A366HRV7_9BACT|nr:HAD family hydrolase [Roseimicrobium gellanilyticum]RBP46412.1 putative hydrolase of the HAD superfamily [Roseimicrobium gellanilyticum]